MQITTSTLLEQKFRSAFDKLDLPKDLHVVLKESNKSQFGDYQVNGIMGIAKKLKIDARELASKVIAAIDKEKIISKLETAGPGFINIFLSDKYLEKKLTKELLQVNAKDHHKTVIDYSSPNLAKEMHVGHLRSTIIGDALVRLYEFLGFEVIRRNHVGDFGTQFGMLIAYLLEIKQKSSDLDLELSDLENFYRKAKTRFDEDPEFAERSREYVVKLQAKDPEIIKFWKQFVNTSLSHCQKIYDKLQTKLTPEDAVGESSYNDLLSKIVHDLVAKGVAIDSDGAKCVFFTPEELKTNEEAPFIIQKKDGAYLYSTTDIAAVYDRIKNLHADHLIYVIDARQSLHLKQLFATVKKADLTKPDTLMQHVAFGTMLGEDNKPFKTRSGDTIKLSSLIDEAIERAKIIVKKRNPGWSSNEINELAETLGISAIKYADLSKNRVCDYVFNFDQMLSFEGNTAPYMLYAYVRIKSIFKKINSNIDEHLDKQITISVPNEHSLALHLIRFPEHMLQAAKENCPHQICAYIYNLAVLFMRFYEHCPIINTKEQNSRLALAALTAKTLKTGLDLLGISVVERM